MASELKVRSRPPGGPEPDFRQAVSAEPQPQQSQGFAKNRILETVYTWNTMHISLCTRGEQKKLQRPQRSSVLDLRCTQSWLTCQARAKARAGTRAREVQAISAAALAFADGHAGRHSTASNAGRSCDTPVDLAGDTHEMLPKATSGQVSAACAWCALNIVLHHVGFSGPRSGVERVLHLFVCGGIWPIPASSLRLQYWNCKKLRMHLCE